MSPNTPADPLATNTGLSRWTDRHVTSLSNIFTLYRGRLMSAAGGGRWTMDDGRRGDGGLMPAPMASGDPANHLRPCPIGGGGYTEQCQRKAVATAGSQQGSMSGHVEGWVARRVKGQRTILGGDVRCAESNSEVGRGRSIQLSVIQDQGHAQCVVGFK